MQINEPNVTILLLSIIVASLFFHKKEVIIPKNRISVTDYYQIPYYSPNHPNNQPLNNPNIEIDRSKHLIKTTNSDIGKSWMRRYKRGIRFEFYPP